MTSPHRRRRGAETQRWVAGYLANNGFPHATDAGAGRGGEDILGTPGVAIEVKARRELRLGDWLRQACKAAAGRLPLVVHRPDGMGVATVADWPVTLRLSDAVQLLRAAGYGDPLPAMSPAAEVPWTPKDEAEWQTRMGLYGIDTAGRELGRPVGSAAAEDGAG